MTFISIASPPILPPIKENLLKVNNRNEQVTNSNVNEIQVLQDHHYTIDNNTMSENSATITEATRNTFSIRKDSMKRSPSYDDIHAIETNIEDLTVDGNTNANSVKSITDLQDVMNHLSLSKHTISNIHQGWKDNTIMILKQRIKGN